MSVFEEVVYCAFADTPGGGGNGGCQGAIGGESDATTSHRLGETDLVGTMCLGCRRPN